MRTALSPPQLGTFHTLFMVQFGTFRDTIMPINKFEMKLGNFIGIEISFVEQCPNLGELM